MPDPIQTLRDADTLMRKAQAILAVWVEPGRMTDRDALNELLSVLDGPEQRRVQLEIRSLLTDHKQA
jgi:hypothetical protein